MDDDWEFPSFINNQDHGYSNDPKDSFVDFTDDELRAIRAFSEKCEAVFG